MKMIWTVLAIMTTMLVAAPSASAGTSHTNGLTGKEVVERLDDSHHRMHRLMRRIEDASSLNELMFLTSELTLERDRHERLTTYFRHIREMHGVYLQHP